MQTIMKNKKAFFSSSIFALLLIISFVGCKKYDGITPIPSEGVAEFAPASGSFIADYYIKSTNDPFSIPVGFTNFSDVDRTITFTATSKTAVAGTQFVAPGSVTIKAGKVLDTLKFKGLFAGYTGGRKDTVTIKFSGYPALGGQDSFRVVIRPYCDVVAANLTGAYANTRDYYPAVGSNPSASKYTATISSWTPLTSTTATIVIQNLGLTTDIGFGPFGATDPAKTGITATADWTDPANFKITIASQPYMASLYTYGAATISGSGTFSACDQTFTIGYTVKVAAGSFLNTWTVLTR